MQKIAVAILPDAAGARLAANARRDAFVQIMREGRWGPQTSGGGSTVEYTRATRGILQQVIRDYGITSMLDAGCGDLGWLPVFLESAPPGFRYIGVDIVPDLVEQHQRAHPQHEFIAADLVVDAVPRCDLIVCRDVVQHLPIADARRVLANFSRSGARYLLTTTHLRSYGWRNGRDRRVGRCQDRNLLLKPFSLADPLAIYSERDPGHKFLGLWELPLRTAEGSPYGCPPI
jgi:SAM-dependent methyltransferase